MNRIIGVLFAVVALAGCGGGAAAVDPVAPTIIPPNRKPDPYITIRVRNLLDTTTSAGKAHWHVYALLTGPYVNQNGISFQGAISLADIRLGHNLLCVAFQADSVGQRLISVIALADTTNAGLSPDATARSIADSWYGGNYVLPAGWTALFNAPADAWLSAQYLAGHGQIPTDPIKWGLDWTGNGIVSLYERTDTDQACNRF